MIRMLTNLPFNKPLKIRVAKEVGPEAVEGDKINLTDSHGRHIPLEVTLRSQGQETEIEIRPVEIIQPGDYVIELGADVRDKRGRSVFGGLSLGLTTERT